ncbi:hypothetical protein Tco_0046773 [Tanacetum coccineum]
MISAVSWAESYGNPKEHYEDILPVIMDKIRRDKQKEVHVRLDFEESPKKRRIREGSQNLSARTLSASTTKSGPDRANSRDRSHGRTHPHRQDSSTRDRPRSRDRSRGVEESYDNTRSSYWTGTKHGYRSRDRDRSRHEKKGRETESPSSRVSESGTSDGGHWKSRSKRHKSMDEDDLAVS